MVNTAELHTGGLLASLVAEAAHLHGVDSPEWCAWRNLCPELVLHAGRMSALNEPKYLEHAAEVTYNSRVPPSTL